MTELSDKITAALEEARKAPQDNPWSGRVVSSLEEAELYSTQVPGSDKSADELAQDRALQSDQDRIAELEAELSARGAQQQPDPQPQDTPPPAPPQQ